MILTAKFKIGDRVTVEPMDEEEAQQLGTMNGIITKVDTDDYGDGEVAYVVRLDHPLANYPARDEPAVDAVEWELTAI